MNPYEEINLSLNEASKYINTKVNDGILEMLTTPWREIVVSCPIKMDNGETKVFSGYRIQHNAVRGPYKGGVRFHPDANHSEITRYSRESVENRFPPPWLTAPVGFNRTSL